MDLNSSLPPNPETYALGIIGGSSLLKSSFFASTSKRIVETTYGEVQLYFGDNFIFCQRHHADPAKEYTPPHLINTKAIIEAFKQCNVERVIAFCSVGSLKREIPIGSIVIPDDYFNLFNIITFYDDYRSHHVPSLDTDFRREVIEVLRNGGFGGDQLITRGTYIQTTGPRFETKAEVRFLAMCADIVGMTAAFEAVLTAELKLPYAIICMVDNYGHGLELGPELSMEQFNQCVKNNERTVETALSVVLQHYVPASAPISPMTNH